MITVKRIGFPGDVALVMKKPVETAAIQIKVFISCSFYEIYFHMRGTCSSLMIRSPGLTESIYRGEIFISGDQGFDLIIPFRYSPVDSKTVQVPLLSRRLVDQITGLTKLR